MIDRNRAEFSSDELSAVLSQYDIGAIHRLEPLKKGSRKSPKMIVTADRGQFLLKRRAPGRDNVQKVAFSHAVQRYLAEAGFPLPHLCRSRVRGDTLLRHEDRIYELFEWISGGSYDASLPVTRDVGRVLGLFHQTLRGFRGEWDPPHYGYHDNNGVRTSLTGIPGTVGKHDSVMGREAELLGTVSRLFEAYDHAAEIVERAGFRQWPSQIVHADWHPGNMLFVDGHVAAVIDYDSLRWLPSATDVANGLLQFSIRGGGDDPMAWPLEPDLPRLLDFLAGYESVCVIPDAQRRVLPYLMAEALIAEAVLPVAATGSFGRIEGFRFLVMVCRKAEWLTKHSEELFVVH